MDILRRTILILSALGLTACAGSGIPEPGAPGTHPIEVSEARGATIDALETPGPEDPGTVWVTLIQLNDIYEITPMGGGRWGGPARVATVYQRQKELNPNTFMLLAGDLFSPSALGTARVEGERLAGRQMVAVLNQMGLDYATFGNHEFDLDEEAFRKRMEESRFGWVCNNVTDASGELFKGVTPTKVIRVDHEDGRVMRIGLIGVVMDSNQPSYVRISDPLEAAKVAAASLRDTVDALVALTHVPVGLDIALAEAIPDLDLIVGGHEHENMRLYRGEDFTPILKADANVRTLYIHHLKYDLDTEELDIDSNLLPITDEIPQDPATKEVADHWVALGYAGFRESGFEPEEVVAQLPEPLDGLEISVRNRPTALTEILTAAMQKEIDGAQGALLNAGSIRVDDVLPPGSISQYDVIRILPFGGPIMGVEMTGSLLTEVLDQGERNQGEGGYLQLAGIRYEEGLGWCMEDGPINPDATYKLAVADFLISGREQGLGFLNRENPALTVLSEGRDIRAALMDELKARYRKHP
jgi:5'-nucleotidase